MPSWSRTSRSVTAVGLREPCLPRDRTASLHYRDRTVIHDASCSAAGGEATQVHAQALYVKPGSAKLLECAVLWATHIGEATMIAVAYVAYDGACYLLYVDGPDAERFGTRRVRPWRERRSHCRETIELRRTEDRPA